MAHAPSLFRSLTVSGGPDEKEVQAAITMLQSTIPSLNPENQAIARVGYELLIQTYEAELRATEDSEKLQEVRSRFITAIHSLINQLNESLPAPSP